MLRRAISALLPLLQYQEEELNKLFHACNNAHNARYAAQALGSEYRSLHTITFFVDSHQGAAVATVQPLPSKPAFLYDPFPYQTHPLSTMDSGDNLYSMWSNGGECEIVQASLYNTENSNVGFTRIVGGTAVASAAMAGLRETPKSAVP